MSREGLGGVFRASIRTKLIGGYLVVVMAILALVATSYWVQKSTVDHATFLYQDTEQLRLALEAENLLWRQVAVGTDFLLRGRPDDAAAFNALAVHVRKHLTAFRSLATHPDEDDRQASRIVKLYDIFVVTFEQAARLQRNGNHEAALRLEVEKVDPAEHEVEAALHGLVRSKRLHVDEDMRRVRLPRAVTTIFPFLSVTLDNAEIIHREGQRLQASLEAESAFWKQVVALHDFLLFEKDHYMGQFEAISRTFPVALERQGTLDSSAQDTDLRTAIGRLHTRFGEAFQRMARTYTASGKTAALRIETEEIDPTEKELRAALQQSHTIRLDSIGRSLENVRVNDAATLAVTKSVGLEVAVVLICGLVVWVAIVAAITRPLRELVLATQRVAAGDLQVRTAARSGDEVGDLVVSFNLMTEALQKDITERDRIHRNLDALVEARTAHLQAILASMGEGICVTDTAGRVLMWNLAAEKISGVLATAVVGAVYPASVRGAYGDRAVTDFSGTIMKRALDAGEPISSTEAHFIRPDGSRVPLAATAAPIRNTSGVVVGCVNVLRDITREKELEQMKSDFVSTVSHELRTPLTSIRAYGETLRGMVGGDATAQEFLRVIDEESQRLGRLIDKLLNLSRIESGKAWFKAEPVSLEPLIQRVIETTSPAAAANSLQISTEVPSSLPAFRGDDEAIGQVLLNLVDNAVKYNRPGGRVDVRVRIDGGLAVEIRDTGIGIPDAAVQRLGERFFRVNALETRRIGGTGLGLSLVKEILAAHGTRLEVQSQAGKGSIFRFVLPLAGSHA